MLGFGSDSLPSAMRSISGKVPALDNLWEVEIEVAPTRGAEGHPLTAAFFTQVRHPRRCSFARYHKAMRSHIQLLLVHSTACVAIYNVLNLPSQARTCVLRHSAG